MTDLSLFRFEGSGVRAESDENGEPWFVLADLCDLLGIANRGNVAARLADDEKGVRPADTPGGRQSLTFVNESGLWSVILRSDSPSAEPVRRWVTHDVLPAIRKTGTYSKPQTLAERSLALLGELTSEVQRQAAVIESQAPLVAQATQYAAGAGDVIRSRFARDFISWAHKERGVTVKQPEVMAFLGRKLGLFVVGERSDAGEATIRAERDGLAHTKRGTSDSGHNYGTGVLTPAGQQYAWERAVRYLDEHGTLELPRLTAVGA